MLVPRFLALFCPSKLILVFHPWHWHISIWTPSEGALGISKWQTHWWPLLLQESGYFQIDATVWVGEIWQVSNLPKWSIGFCDLWIIWIVLATKTDQKNIMFNTLIFKRFAYGGNNWKGGWMICLRLHHGWHKHGSSWDDDDDHFMGSIEWIRA